MTDSSQPSGRGAIAALATTVFGFDGVEVVGDLGSREADGEPYGVVRLRRTEVLLPLRAPRAAARSLQRRSGFTSRRGIAIAGAAAAVMRTGLPQRRARTGIILHRTPPIMSWLHETFGRDDLVLTIGVGIPRPNAKPVAQVLSRAGEILGVAKIGASSYTDALVRAENGALAHLAPYPFTFRVPRTLGTTELHGHPILLQEPLESWDWRGQPTKRVPMVIVRALAALDPSRDRLDAGPYIARLAGRLADAGSSLPGSARSINREFDFGAWHGDLTPWNLVESRPTPTRPALAVWDWERFARDVPVGFDVMHFGFHALRASHGDRAALMAAAADLGATGLVAPPNVGVVATLYLAEMVARFADPALAEVAESRALGARLTALLADDPLAP